MTSWTLDELRVFCAVAQAGSMSAAADTVHLSTPAISAKIKSLEASFDVILFERRASGIALTAAGSRLLAHAYDLLEKANLLTEDVRDYSLLAQGTVKLAANTTAVTEYLPDLLSHFMAENAKVDVALSEEISSEVVRQVREGRADFGIFTPGPETNDLLTLPFRKDRLALVVHNSHVWANRVEMTYAESLISDHVCLQRSAALSRYLWQKAQEVGRPLRGRIYLAGFDAVARMASRGVGVAVMPQSAAIRLSSVHALQVLRLTDDWADNELRFVLRDLETLSVAAQSLLSALQRKSSVQNI
jgi:DNA-binding transcriptional LysR family regulator